MAFDPEGLYLDENGQVIDPSQVDWGRYEAVPVSASRYEPPESPSLYDWSRATIARSFPEVARMGGAVMDWIEQPKPDLFPDVMEMPYGGIDDVISLIEGGTGTNYGREVMRRADAFDERINRQVPMDPTSIEGIVSAQVPGLVRMGATLALAPEALIPEFGAEGFLESYASKREQDVPADSATKWALPDAAMSALTAALIPKAIGQPGQGILRSALTHGIKTPAVMGGMSLPSTATSLITNAGATGAVPTIEDIDAAMWEGVKSGTVTGLGFGGLGATKQAVGSAFSGARQRQAARRMAEMEAELAKAEATEPLMPEIAPELMRLEYESVPRLEYKPHRARESVELDLLREKAAVEAEVQQIAKEQQTKEAPKPLIEVKESIPSEPNFSERQLTETIERPKKIINPESVTFLPKEGKAVTSEQNTEVKRIQDAAAWIDETGALDHPIHAVELNRIDVNAELMQFKKHKQADKETGTNENDRIDGTWDDIKAGIFLLWEPIDKTNPAWKMKPGKDFLVANGHHRKEGAERMRREGDRPVSVVAVQILREADGYTAAQARGLAAEANIADGKGTLEDHVKYFQHIKSEYGEAEALDRANKAGKRGESGKLLALQGSDNLLSGFFSDKITDKQAEIIVKTAPGDEALQQVGIKAAMDNVPLHEIRAQMQAMLEDPSWRNIDTSVPVQVKKAKKGKEPEQVPIWGKKSPQQKIDAMMDKYSAMAKVAVQWQKYWRAHLRVLTGAARDRQTTGITVGGEANVDVRNKKLAEEHILRAETELDRWEHYHRYEDLLQKTKDGEGPPLDQGVSATAAKEVGDALKEQPKKAWVELVDNEEGFIGFGRKLDPPTDKGTVNEKWINEHESFMRGYWNALGLKDYKDPAGLYKVRSWWRDSISFPKTLADRIPQFAPVFENKRHQWAARDSIAFEMADTMRPYFELADTTNVDAMLAIARERGYTFKPTRDVLRKTKLGDAEIDAFFSVREGMDQGLEVLRTALYAKKQLLPEQEQTKWREEVDVFVDEIRAENFVPFSRFGDYYLHVKDPATGETQHFSLYETRKEAKRAAKAFEGEKDVGELVRPSVKHARTDLPAELLGRLAKLDPEAYDTYVKSQNSMGFTQHLAHGKLTPGYEKNFRRNIADYIMKLSNYAAYQEYNPKIQQAIENIPKNMPSVYDYASRYAEKVDNVTFESAKIRQAFAHYYLGFNLKSALVNMTQSVTTTYPLLSKYSDKPAIEWKRAHQMAGQYITSKEGFAKSYPELAIAMKEALSQGYITEKQVRELYGYAKGTKGKSVPQTIGEASMAMFGAAEKYNRIHAFIAAWNVAKKGATSSEKIEFAKDFVDRTQFIYDRSNRPAVFQEGLMPTLFTFRGWAGNWLRLLRNEWNWNPTKNSVGKRMLGTMLALGGTSAMPFLGALEKALIASGEDPKKLIRENTGAFADVIMYGLPTVAGLNISGAMAAFSLDPNLERNPAAAAVRMVVGVPADIPQRLSKANYLYGQTKDWKRAVEPLLPEAARNVAVAGRAAWDQGWRTPQGELILMPSLSEMVVKAIGFTPPRLQRGYEKGQSEYVFKQNVLNQREHFNRWIGQAYAKGDIQEANRLMQVVFKHNQEAKDPKDLIRLDKSAIKRAYAQYAYTDDYRVKQAPRAAREGMRDIQRVYK